jgi:hypothetical protein
MAITAELFIDEAWLNITRLDDDTRLLAKPGERGVSITRGRAGAQGRVTPQKIAFEYLDRNGTLDGENPYSPYFRKIGLGTPLRVKVDDEVRCIGELSKLDPFWDDAHNNVVVQVEAVGILARLMGEDQQPLHSPAYRAITAPENDVYRVAYWPMEEQSGADVIGSPYDSGTVSYVDVTFGGSTDSMSSERLITFGTDGLLFAVVPNYSSSEHKVICQWTLPETSLAANTTLMRFYCTSGNVGFIDLEYRTSVDGDLRLRAFGGGGVVDTSGTSDFSDYILNQNFYMKIGLNQDGADLDITITIIADDREDTTSTVAMSDTLTGVTLGRIAFVTVAETDCSGAAFGQLAIGNNADAFINFDETLFNAMGARGFINERGRWRMERLAAEEGIDLTFLTAGLFDTDVMGRQTAKTFMDLIYECADADGGILYEARDSLGLVYRSRQHLYNQAAVATLPYGRISPPFGPTTENLSVTNAVTAKRDGGSSFEYVIPDDDYYHWTTQPPPAGANRRPVEVSLNLYSDTQLDQAAGWIAHVASWREKRYSVADYILSRSSFTADEIAALRAADLGDVIQQGATGAPRWIPYNEVRLMLQGYTESLNQRIQKISISSSPADAYEVEVTETGGSTLVVAIDDNDTTIRLATSVGPSWSTTDQPYNIQIAGQPMTITAINASTPAFIAAGTVAHADNASVSPGLPAGMTVDTGHLMLLWAAIRNSGTGTVNTPTGWDLIPGTDFGNVALFGRYYVTGDAAPTVTFTGGVAGATTSARILGFSGLSKELASGTNLDPVVYTQLNASAQNIGYPALLVAPGRTSGAVALVFAWKQDDSSGTDPPAGFTEAFDSFSTSGDDQSIYAASDLSAASAAAGSLVVTGGAAAISRGIVLALRPLQAATVTRGIAGVATSAAAGAEVRTWRMGVNGL